MDLSNNKLITGRQLSWISLFLLVIAEVFAVSFLTDARSIADTGIVNGMLLYAGDALKWAITAAAIFVILIFNETSRIDALLSKDMHLQRYLWVVPLHLVCYATFLYLTVYLFRDQNNIGLPELILWIVLILAVTLSYSLWVANPRGIVNFFIHYKLTLAIAAGGGLVVVLVSIGSRFLWEPLSAFTMNGSYALLDLIYDDLLISVEEKYLGANQFTVHIAPVCSGVEGAVLSLGITSAYLYFSREEFVFPLAFVLLPIAATLSILFNIIRVALLISIGASISEEIAVEGFHSVAGWISSVLISLLIIFVFSSWKSLHKNQGIPTTETIESTKTSEGHKVSLATAILLPFVLFMMTTLIAGIFKQDFDYLYPLKLAIPLAALMWFLPTYRLALPKSMIEPVVVGVLVAILWALLVPTEPLANQQFSIGLTSMPLWLAIGWCLARAIGFWVFAPIAEELLFRCYLMNRLSGTELKTNGRLSFSILAFVVSSVLFGALHAHWLAGMVAGALFAISRYRSDTVASPIIAHAVANVAVSIWAVYTQNWVLL